MFNFLRRFRFILMVRISLFCIVTWIPLRLAAVQGLDPLPPLELLLPWLVAGWLLGAATYCGLLFPFLCHM